MRRLFSGFIGVERYFGVADKKIDSRTVSGIQRVFADNVLPCFIPAWRKERKPALPCIGFLCVVENQKGTVGRVDHLRDGAGRALKPERDGALRHRKPVGKRSGDIFWRIVWGFRRRADRRTEQHDEQRQVFSKF